MWRLPAWFPFIYAFASVATFLAYGIDKQAAKNGARRVRERTLHLLALVGGWPGALLAQQLLRHKSAKKRFRIVFWMTVALNVAAVGFLAYRSMQ